MGAIRASGCLVTGAAGFIGSHLMDPVLSLGHRVVGMDNMVVGGRATHGVIYDFLKKSKLCISRSTHLSTGAGRRRRWRPHAD